MNELIRELQPSFQLSFHPEITLEIELSPTPLIVQADAAQIRQVILNLVQNAAEAVGEHPGKIRIGTGQRYADRKFLNEAHLSPNLPERQYAFVRIEDTGRGIPPEMQSRIFDLFFSTKFTGRGLGLPSALGIVRGHRGALKFESSPGKGSSFEFFLPLASAGSAVEPSLLGGAVDGRLQ